MYETPSSYLFLCFIYVCFGLLGYLLVGHYAMRDNIMLSGRLEYMWWIQIGEETLNEDIRLAKMTMQTKI